MRIGCTTTYSRPALAGLLAWLAQAIAATAAEPAFHYIGDESCQRCHREPLAIDQQPGHALQRTTMKEFAVWQASDQHRRAYAVLKDKRAAAMGVILGYKVHERAECLACHGGPPAVAALAAQDSQPPPQGLGCEACHGPASQWSMSHWRQDWWQKSPREKSREGLYPVREPIDRAALCLSCHLSDVKAGKWVTHDMYAAGHPPLGSFEIEAFTAAMPSHGKPIRQMPKITLAKLGFEADEMISTRYVLAGGLVAARMASDNLRSLAGERASHARQRAVGGRAPAWPDWAALDCSACHHELRLPSARQANRLGQTPGRPRLLEWPWQNDTSTEPASRDGQQPRPPELGVLFGVFQAQPFGNAAEITATAGQVSQALETRLATVSRQRFDAAGSVKRLRELARGGEFVTDFQSARLIAWSLRSTLGDFDGRGTGAGLTAGSIAKIEGLCDDLGGLLDLHLGAQPPGVEARLDARLKIAAAFDAEEVQERVAGLMREIGRELGNRDAGP
jgi:hypothetical protein